MKHPQAVKVRLEFPDGEVGESGHYLEDTNTQNLQGKIQSWVRSVIIGWNTDKGATLVINIEPVEKDEFGRPDPE